MSANLTHRWLLPRRDALREAGGLVVAMLALAAMASGADTGEGVAFFEKQIRPVLVEKCYECHSAKAKKIKGGLLLDTREASRRGGDTGPAVVPGDLKRSLLIEAIHHEDKDLAMPPKEKLPDEVIADFERWIAMGAPDPREGGSAATTSTIDIAEGRKHWAFQPIANPPVPAVKDVAWPRTDIDRFVLAALEAKGLRPVADASPVELRRRIAFDLTGLPPISDLKTDSADFSAKSEIRNQKSRLCLRVRASANAGRGTGWTWRVMRNPRGAVTTCRSRSRFVIATGSSIRSTRTSRTISSSANNSPAICSRPPTTPGATSSAPPRVFWPSA